MLTRENFTKYMKQLCDRADKQEKINDIVMDIDFCEIDITGHEALCIELLAELMNDNHNDSWVQYWFYELKRGTKNDKMKVWHKDGREILLTTIDDLYNILVEGATK